MTVLSHKAPVNIGAVSLTVRDLATVSAFYESVVGLQPITATATERHLGAGGTVLLKLIEDKAAKPASPGSAGLFHTAFLLPTREDLAMWTNHAVENHHPVSGASDHLVSEAIYLDDPEGNGIEIYRDRDPSEWTREGSLVKMATLALDFPSLMQSIAGKNAKWKGAPEGTRVGHIHLKVGNTEEAEAFYQGVLGFDVMTHYPGAAFLATGGYHHHLGANVWTSRGASRREPALGLAAFELEADPVHHAKLKAALAKSDSADPWANRIVLKAK